MRESVRVNGQRQVLGGQTLLCSGSRKRWLGISVEAPILRSSNVLDVKIQSLPLLGEEGRG